MRVTANLNTRAAVATLANVTVDLYIDEGRDNDGEWESSVTKIQSVPANFQKDPKDRIEHLDDGSERRIGMARVSLLFKPTQTPRFIEVSGDFWKVVNDLSRPTREQYKYRLEYLPYGIDETY